MLYFTINLKFLGHRFTLLVLLISTWLWGIEKYQIINQPIIHQKSPYRAIRSYELEALK